MTDQTLIAKYKAREISLEVLLESLIELGNCPALVNDDNGRWAVSETGVQNIPLNDKPSDIQTTFFIEAKDWKPTVRQALIHFYE